MGNISLALAHVESDARLSDLLEQALAASRTAKTLTSRLITFSKGGQPTKKPTDIIRLVENTAAFSLSGSNIRCRLGPSSGIWAAFTDPQQIGQAIHNLMINAAESMPSGGTVSIDVENLTVKRPTSILAPGRYIDIAIKDQGVGIPAEHIEKIFDPYFSTKTKGTVKGTGLGLSISHSIISRHGGDTDGLFAPWRRHHLSRAASPPRKRILMSVDQPVCAASIEGRQKADQTDHPARAKILVMDDEAMIRELTGNMLGHLGYDAEFAEAGQEAVSKYQAAAQAMNATLTMQLSLT
jgi:CheY-like chemotaxis protein